MAVRIDADDLAIVFDRLLSAYGRQHWWPSTDEANPRFEILIGAVLTQHTSWTQVEKAIACLRQAGPLTPQAILDHSDQLPTLIRQAGPHNIKAERLRALARWFIGVGGFESLECWSTTALREGLRSCRGIGAETADAIVVYAFNRSRFIADAYAFRISERLGWSDGPRRYETLQTAVEAAAPSSAGADYYNELHALIVAHAKARCHKQKPDCDRCALVDRCDYGVALT